MNILLRSVHAPCPLALSRLLEEQLRILGSRCRAEEAVVRFVEQREASPRYLVAICVRLPGPDIHATARDHTLDVAVRKALGGVETQLARRTERRQQRRRSNRQNSSAARTGRAW